MASSAAVSKPIAFAFDTVHDLSDQARLALLGGKGKSLSDMTWLIGLPVPPGFTLATTACHDYLAHGWSPAFDEAIDIHLAQIEQRLGRFFGHSANPLLLSVRSGGAASMPGMMDTVLNVGLNADIAPGLAAQNGGDREFAGNCLERLQDSFAKAVGIAPPDDPRAQLRQAIEAVFQSWNSDRAIAYRRIESIAEGGGTAVNVQAMVFGNRDDRSGTGVVFSRNPSTGEKRIFGDVLFRAQGEDVVGGTHRTVDILELADTLPGVAAELDRHMDTIERHYRDLVDVEFTIEAEKLWVLQARPGKRAPVAAVRIAHDMALDPNFPLTRDEALARVRPLLHLATTHDRGTSDCPVLGQGIGASPGIASGALVTTTEAAVRLSGEGKSVILARPETSPEDIEGISAAAGLLTARGGLASHAAVVARGWGKPAVVGWEDMGFEGDGLEIGGRAYPQGTLLSLDGESGEILFGALESRSRLIPEAVYMLKWEGVLDAPAELAISRVAGDDELVLLIALKGFCTRDAACEIGGLESAALATRMDLLAADIDASSPRFLKPTDAGKARAAALIDAHRAALGASAASVTLDSFHRLNDLFKTLVTDWQMRPSDGEPVMNDHSDATYDAAILARMDALHGETLQWLGNVSPEGPLPFFRARFEAAISRLRTGNPAYLASPRIDSYHNIWFELHEYLIRLAGLTRAQAEAR